MLRLTRRTALAGAIGSLAAPGLARAQDWPTRTLRLVVPFTPAGTTASILFQPISRSIIFSA